MTQASPSPAPGEGPILTRLRDVGYEVDSLADLRHSGVRYRKAVPILVGALFGATDKKTQMEVVRALTVPWASPEATPPLIKKFKEVDDETGPGLRWAIGNALDVTWNDDEFDDLVQIARNPAYGRSREMVVLGLGRSRRVEAAEILIELLEDPEVSGHAVKALRKIRTAAARPGLERMLNDSRGWVRNEAKRALADLK